jgi:hypothetical protein
LSICWCLLIIFTGICVYEGWNAMNFKPMPSTPSDDGQKVHYITQPVARHADEQEDRPELILNMMSTYYPTIVVGR